MQKICLGKILGPVGLKGEVKIRLFTESPLSFDQYKSFENERGEALPFFRRRKSSLDDVIVAHAEGVIDRSQAETFSGVKIWVNRSDLPSLSEGEYYHEDLVGLEVVDEHAQSLGKVTGVFNYGAGDFLEIDYQNKTVTLPFNANAVLAISTERMVIDSLFMMG